MAIITVKCPRCDYVKVIPYQEIFKIHYCPGCGCYYQELEGTNRTVVVEEPEPIIYTKEKDSDGI